MAELKDDASTGSKPTSDASEQSRTESVCSRSSRRSSGELHVAQDDVLQELGSLHQEMEQVALQYEGRFRTPVRDLESWSAENAASSAEGTLVEPERVVAFSEPPKDSEIPTSETAAAPTKDSEIPTSETAAAPTQDVKPSSRCSWLSVKLSRLRVSRRKGDKTVKLKAKKKEARAASPSSSRQRLRSTLGPSLGSFGFLAFLLVGIILVFAYAIAFRGGRAVRRREAPVAKKAINGVVTYE
ncbi:hypothetical protein MTO96_008214 [Rhipicephalus appendiculatus]